MPVIENTHGWYTDEEIAKCVPSPRMADGLRPNTPGWWDTLCEPGKYTGDGHNGYFAEVAAVMPDAGRWCDVGCGLGEFLGYMARAKPGLEGWGWDVTPVAVEHARKRLNTERLAVGTLPDWIPWCGVRFDVVTVLEVIEHFPLSAARPVIEAAVSIAPLTILTVPNGLDFASGHFVWYDLELFRSMLPPGYSVSGEIVPNQRHWMFTVTK